jgi:hypothetical protein
MSSASSEFYSPLRNGESVNGMVGECEADSDIRVRVYSAMIEASIKRKSKGQQGAGKSTGTKHSEQPALQIDMDE